MADLIWWNPDDPGTTHQWKALPILSYLALEYSARR